MSSRYQVGEWWIGKKSGRSGWFRCRFNPKTGQTERVSLRTKDFQKAKSALDEWFLSCHRPSQSQSDDITIARVLQCYYLDYAQNTPSEEAARLHSKMWIEYWQEATLGDLTAGAQRKFHSYLRSQGKSDSYIQRGIAVVRAACNYAWSHGLVENKIHFVTLPVTSGEPKGRPLEADEVKALLDASLSAHIERYIVVLLATASRPDAALDLHRDQVDLDRGIITLNPPGRKQTKKFRPTVRCPEFLRPMIESTDQNVVTGSDRVIASIKKGFRETRTRAGLDNRVTSYSIRHTLAREMRSRSVPPWEVAAQLGHKLTGLSTTEIYAVYDPTYLVNAVAAIDDFYQTIKKSG